MAERETSLDIESHRADIQSLANKDMRFVLMHLKGMMSEEALLSEQLKLRIDRDFLIENLATEIIEKKVERFMGCALQVKTFIDDLAAVPDSFANRFLKITGVLGNPPTQN